MKKIIISIVALFLAFFSVSFAEARTANDDPAGVPTIMVSDHQYRN
jgi:hypothetical protein